MKVKSDHRSKFSNLSNCLNWEIYFSFTFKHSFETFWLSLMTIFPTSDLTFLIDSLNPGYQQGQLHVSCSDGRSVGGGVLGTELKETKRGKFATPLASQLGFVIACTQSLAFKKKGEKKKKRNEQDQGGDDFQ